MRVPADDEVGAGVDEPPPDQGLDRLGDVGVLRAPVGEHDDHVDPLRSSLGPTPTTWARSARLSGPVRGGIRTDSAPGVCPVACGVSPIALKPRNPKRTPFRVSTAGPGRRPQVPPGAEGLDPAVPERPRWSGGAAGSP